MDKPLTSFSVYGAHCNTCGSLVDACGDILKCRAEAGFEIEEAIRKGSEDHPLLVTAHRMLGETILGLREGVCSP